CARNYYGSSFGYW
nr:immunoglobulin heavy chain junction region [Mus musculus]